MRKGQSGACASYCRDRREADMSSTSDVPILLLDVDGVLNAPRVDLPEGWQRGFFNGFALSWDPTVTTRLRKLHDAGRVEIQWLTTWAADADRLLAEPMGLPRRLWTHARADALPTGFAEPLGGRSGWWKLAVAREVAAAEPDRRIIWIDDDLAEQAADTGEWLAAHPHVLVIAPDLLTGLTHEQLDQVEAWL
jgi:HAD domain in Swiss Army Knife RNA repair proteins